MASTSGLDTHSEVSAREREGRGSRKGFHHHHRDDRAERFPTAFRDPGQPADGSRAKVLSVCLSFISLSRFISLSCVCAFLSVSVFVCVRFCFVFRIRGHANGKIACLSVRARACACAFSLPPPALPGRGVAVVWLCIALSCLSVSDECPSPALVWPR